MANTHLAGDTADVDDLAISSIMFGSEAARSSQYRPTAEM